MGNMLPRGLLALLAVLLVAGCGSGSRSGADTKGGTSTSALARRLPAAARPALTPRAADFPAPQGRSLQKLADSVTPAFQVGLSASTFVPGAAPQRVPFALLDQQGRPVYGATAVYVARGPKAPARGPFLAPGDSLAVAPAFRAKTTDSADIKLIYRATVPLPKAGRYALLVVTRRGGKLLGGATSIPAHATKIPARGQKAPIIATPTLRSARGNVASIDTRLPPSDMHAVSFGDVVGHKPVALLFSTPALCQSRVCGPVTDVLMETEQRYRGKVDFIHQEIYRDNQVSKGLRPQLAAFDLRTEPWLFTVDRHGRIAARLEGAFGMAEADAAVRAALR